MRLEPARPEDLPGILSLLGRHGLPSEDLGADHLQHFLVLRDASGLAGVAGLEVHGADGLLRSVAVADSQQRQGRGAGLVSAIEARAKRLKLAALYLLTTEAAGYFEKSGYRQVGREQVPPAIQASREFSALCPTSAVCMKKSLAY